MEIATRSNHVSIQALKYEPPELIVQPEVYCEPEPENKSMQEMLARLNHLTADDPKNFTILFMRTCRRMTFREIGLEPCIGMDEDSVRHRFNWIKQRLDNDSVEATKTFKDYRSQSKKKQQTKTTQFEFMFN